jgi:hypothetical protein
MVDGPTTGKRENSDTYAEDKFTILEVQNKVGKENILYTPVQILK